MSRRIGKLIIPAILIIILAFNIGSCAKKTQTGPDTSPTATTTENKDTTLNAKPTENIPTSSPLPIVAEPLSASDFTITDGKNVISLYIDFMNLKIDKKEHDIENNYVGDTQVDGFIYKYFVHEYDDFDLFVSNANYNLKGKDFDDRYISQISLKNKSDFKTPRGITIGSKLDEVLNAYGQTDTKTEEGNEFVDYKFEDMGLKFNIDANKVVTGIIIDIIVKSAE